MRRVFLVVPELEHRTGAAQQFVVLAELLADHGIDVTAFFILSSRLHPGYERSLRAAGVRLVRGRAGHAVPLAGAAVDVLTDRLRAGRRRPLGVDGVIEGLVEVRPDLVEFRRQLRRASAIVRPDVVHVHGFRLNIGDAAAVAAGDGHPVVYTEHAAIAEGDDHFPLVPDCDWEVLVAVDVISCVSSATCDVLRAVVPDATPVRRASHVVGPAPRAPRRAPGGPLTVLCLSRLAPDKGPEVVVEALGLLLQRGVQVEATFAGYGPMQSTLEDRVADLGLTDTVHFLGGYEHADLDRFLAEADVVVSTAHTDAHSVALVEAFAHGVPVVAAAVGGVGELVVDEVSGLLVPPGDPVATADALVRLQDPALRAALARGARRAFDQGGYTPDEAFAATIDLYAQARARASERGVSLPTGAAAALAGAYSRAVTRTRRRSGRGRGGEI